MDLNLETTKQAEMSLIGAILIDEKSLVKVIDKVTAKDFYFDNLRLAYEAILKLSNAGESIDYITVLHQVNADNPSYETEMKKLLFDCANAIPFVSHIKNYADIISKSRVARDLTNLISETFENGVTSENSMETAEHLISKVSEMVSANRKKKLVPIESVASDLFKTYGEDTRSQENRCDTGFSKFDSILKGMSAGNLIILASRPKVGKTSFAIKVAQNAAKNGKKVVFYSQEMLGTELCERLIAENSTVAMNTLIDKKFQDKSRPEDAVANEVNSIAKSVDEICQYPILINDSPSVSMQDIRFDCRLISNLGLIIVDYLQLMKSTKKAENRNNEIGQISRELKCLATELNVPILCLSQLNRVSDENKRPSPSELRDSGSIEQDANKVLLMWCVEKHLNEKGFLESKTIGIDIALNRRGNTGVTLFNFSGKHIKFTELEKKYAEKEETSNWRNRFI